MEPLGEDLLAGDSKEWEYAMRRGMQEVIPGVFLGPYAAARKNQVCPSITFLSSNMCDVSITASLLCLAGDLMGVFFEQMVFRLCKPRVRPACLVCCVAGPDPALAHTPLMCFVSNRDNCSSTHCKRQASPTLSVSAKNLKPCELCAMPHQLHVHGIPVRCGAPKSETQWSGPFFPCALPYRIDW